MCSSDLLGYYINKDNIEKIRNMNKYISIFLLIILLSITFVLSDKFINIELFKDAQSYKYSNVKILNGICIRIYQFVVAIGISVSLINLIYPLKCPLTKIGQKTISIYILSPFIQEILYRLIKNATPIIIGNNIITLITCIVISIVVILICSLDKVYSTYNKFIDTIYKKIKVT